MFGLIYKAIVLTRLLLQHKYYLKELDYNGVISHPREQFKMSQHYPILNQHLLSTVSTLPYLMSKFISRLTPPRKPNVTFYVKRNSHLFGIV